MGTKGKSLPEKQFVLRNSLLTDLFENEHIRTVYHLFIATFIGMFVNTAAHDYLRFGKIQLGLDLIKSGFGNLHLAFVGWLGFMVSACLVFVCFKVWAKTRKTDVKNPKVTSMDIIWMCMLLAYYIASFQIAAKLVVSFDLSPASAAFIVTEQTRILMKIHAFIRSNISKVTSHKPHTDKFAPLPTFKKFLYFLFIPTLIYRDEYPRTKTIRASFIFYRLLEIVAVLFYLSFVIERFLNPCFREFGLKKFTVGDVILSVLENTITGILILMSCFFLILHSWQNLFAELTMFGDRMFYKDWWTCTSFSMYFRTWNVIVHDWLYTYIYKDMCEVVTKNNKILSKYAVFVVSAVVHEWILTYMLGFFFPLLFIEFFIFGSILNFINGPKIPILNILFWYGLALGMGTLVSMYGLEFYARMNTPMSDSPLDFFIPRFLTCNCIDL